MVYNFTKESPASEMISNWTNVNKLIYRKIHIDDMWTFTCSMLVARCHLGSNSINEKLFGRQYALFFMFEYIFRSVHQIFLVKDDFITWKKWIS